MPTGKHAVTRKEIRDNKKKDKEWIPQASNDDLWMRLMLALDTMNDDDPSVRAFWKASIERMLQEIRDRMKNFDQH